MISSQWNEAETRYNAIDPLLKAAKWNLADRREVAFEVPVNGYDRTPENGITDYTLYRSNGEVLAVIEAKSTKRDARVGKEQLRQYLDKIAAKQSFQPFGFLTNGTDIWFWDAVDYPERAVAGFYTKDDLERLLFLQQNRAPLLSIPIRESIVNRGYQTEAIRRLSERIEQKKKRKALLVMATGTGKTRTTMALVDVFLRARRAQKVLFLADRDSLVEQALSDGFKVHLPHESRERIRTGLLKDKTEATKIHGAHILVATLQTLELCYEEFSPGAFDLIVSDEAHRSIYNKFSDVLAYFDAIQIGLTATPAHFIDRNTFKFFETDGAAPTFLYTYDEAVKEGYLADYNVWAAQTKFQRKGIKGVELDEAAQEALRERGLAPEDIDFEGTDLEKKVTNQDTLFRQWEEFMTVCHKDAGGQLPAKSIVFAFTHKHALRLEAAFNEMYPEHKGLLARVITSQTERYKELLRQFKQEDMPRIAISVDMLDTGVDVPEVMNLAFMKPIGSQIKFWQMIGRGTRSMEACRRLSWLPGHKKESFLIVDYWENFEHFNMMPQTDAEGPAQIPVRTGIFNTRLAKLALLLGQHQGADFKRILSDVRADIAAIPLTSFSVRQGMKDILEAWDDTWYQYLTTEKLELLRLKVAPLLRFAPTGNLAEAFFTSKMERLSLALLEGKDISAAAEGIRADIDLLPRNLSQVAPVLPLINAMLSGDWWAQPTAAKADEARRALAPLMKYKRDKPSPVIELGLDDIMETRKWVVLSRGAGSQKMMVEDYKAKVEARIRQIAGEHPVVQRLVAGEAVSLPELLSLEHTLELELRSDSGLALSEDNMLKAFGVRVGVLTDFLKYVLRLEEVPLFDEVVKRAFDTFIREHDYNADQTRFLRTVQSVFLQRRKLALDDLYEAPFTNFGMGAVEKLFKTEEVEEIIEMTAKLCE